jgi:hypothetical protein
MVALLADENFNGKLLAGLREALPACDVVRVQDLEIYQAPDPQVLEWAAQHGRVLLTHDVQTVVGYAYQRVKLEKPMPGVIEVDVDLPLGRALDDLILMLVASQPHEFENQVRYIPLS